MRMREQLGYVAESDLDLILVLDAWSCGPLTRFLAERAGVRLGAPVTAARSTLRCAGQRETDVEISWPRGALLVEDKVDAAFTPGQPGSYRVEVDARRRAGEDVRSVLVCPRRRRTVLELEADGAFDAIVECEDLAEVAEASGDRAGAGAAIVLRAAAAPRPNRPVTPVDEVRSEWGDGYRRTLVDLLPGGARLDPGPGSMRAATADWMSFLSAGIDPPGVWALAHWVPGGQVRMDLMVLDEPTGLPPHVDIIRKPTMFWLIAPVPAMTFQRPAEQQREQLGEAVSAALSLRAWAAGAGLRERRPKRATPDTGP